VGTELARLGITSVTDATPMLSRSALEIIADAQRNQSLPQRLILMGCGDREITEAGLQADVGATKIVLDECTFPSLDELCATIQASHEDARPAAIHAVSNASLLLALTALAEVGVFRDRVEHAAEVSDTLASLIRYLDISIITQPGFIADRGDDLVSGNSCSSNNLYRDLTLRRAGVNVRISSDAPHGPLSPWEVIHAATTRSTSAGKVVGPAERVSPEQALSDYLSEPEHWKRQGRTVTVGAVADLVLLGRPLKDAFSELPRNPVRTTLIAGKVAWPPPSVSQRS